LQRPFLGQGISLPFLYTITKKMKAEKLISRWWWLIVVLLFSFTLIYFIWNTQRQVNK
jgi:type II secretory pathway component PulF